MFPLRCLVLLLLASASLSAQTAPAFPGAESGAPWRKEAEDKIEKLRKADLTVLVKDASDAPIKDAAITLKQQRHAFPFSIVVDPAMFGANGTDDAEARTYRDKVAALFDMPRAAPDADAAAVEKMRQWALGIGLRDPAAAPATEAIIPALDSATLPQPAEYIAGLKGVAEPELPLRLEDVKLPVDPADPKALELQAFYLRDLLTAAFADSRIAEVEFSGLWSKDDEPTGWTLFNHDWSARPVAAMLEQLLRKTWWTDDGGLTGATGEWKTRAFLGDYRISVSDGTRTKTVSASLSAPESKVEITLADEPPAPSPSPSPSPK